MATDLAKSREKLLKWLQALHDSGRFGIDEILRVVDMDMLGENVSDTDAPEMTCLAQRRTARRRTTA